MYRFFSLILESIAAIGAGFIYAALGSGHTWW
jgi:hypothetical protein